MAKAKKKTYCSHCGKEIGKGRGRRVGRGGGRLVCHSCYKGWMTGKW